MTEVTQSTRRWMRRVVVLLAVSLALAIAAEAFLRTYSSPVAPGSTAGNTQSLLPIMQQILIQESAGQVTYAADPDLGALMAPSHRAVIETPQYTYMLLTDHAGFPNRDPWPAALDVAVLGDSLLMGPGVGLEGQFTTLLGHELGGRSVLNFAVPGGGTEHQNRIYRKFVEPMRPRLVVAVLWVTWDIDNSLQFDRWRAEKSSMDFTQYRMTFPDTHPADTHSGDAPKGPSHVEQLVADVRSFLGRSYLLRSIYLRVKSSRAPHGIVESVTFPNGQIVFLAARDQTRLAQGLDRPAAPDIKDVFFQPLVQLKSEVEGHGGRFVVMLVPSKEELYAADSYPDVLRPWQQVKVELDARHLPTLDLYPIFRRLGHDRPPFYQVDAHLNPSGNQIVADALAKWIAEQGIFP